MGKLKFLELFSGIGGYRTGLERLEFECVGYVEKSKRARSMYQTLYKTEGLWTAGNLCKLSGAKLGNLLEKETVDIVCGGLPKFTGGLVGGTDEVFNSLITTLEAVKPKAVLFSTTLKIIGDNKGLTWATIVERLSGAGYRVDYTELNSSNYGVPQVRKRLYIVGVREDLIGNQPWKVGGVQQIPRSKRRLGSIVGLKTFNFNWQDGAWVHETLVGVLGKRVSEKHYLTDEAQAVLTRPVEGFRGVVDVDGAVLVVYEATERGYALAREGDSVNIQFPYSTTRRGRVGRGVANTVVTRCSQGVVVYDRERGEYRIRKLTPGENWLLQGFTSTQYSAVRGGRSATELYTHAGKAVTVDVVTALGHELAKLIETGA